MEIVYRERSHSYNVTQRRVRATIVALEKTINVTYSECLFVALGIQHAMRMRYIVICDLTGYNILPRYFIHYTIF